MNYKPVMFVGHLKVGDVVRAIHGGRIGGPHDFRQGYDVMTVYRVTDEYVSFVRPYLHVNSDGTLGPIGVEHVDNVSRDHGGHWYELLGGPCDRERIDEAQRTSARA